MYSSETLKDSCPALISPRQAALPFCSAEFTKALLDQAVVGQSNALLVDLAVTSLVDQLVHRLQVGVTETVTFKKRILSLCKLYFIVTLTSLIWTSIPNN